MSAAKPIILVLGAGARVGIPVAQQFASKGYRVALAARSINEAESTDDQLNIKADFANPGDVANAFVKTTEKLGTSSVVVYNASSVTFTPPEDPFAIPLENFNRDTTINITSAFVAAQQAAAGFAQLPASAARTFILTGNLLNTTILPRFMDQGMGKSAGSHMMWAASAAYKDRGFRFYYADERKADGTAIYKVNGDAHADHYWRLAEDKTQGPWLQTFVKGTGYTKFAVKFE